MKNSSLTTISSLNSNNLKDEINSFKNKFENKSQYFLCEQDIVGLTMNKYLDIIENFVSSNLKKLKNNFVIKIYKLIKKRSIETSRLLSKFELLEKKIDNQQLILERSFDLNSKLQKEVDYINNEIINNIGDRELNRILALDSESRSDLDKSYMRARARSDRGGISNTDFNVNSSLMSSYKLFDKDIISIPKKYDFIEVIGAIRNPGRYPFIMGRKVGDYIEMAGGITGNSTNKYYVIESGTGDRIYYKDFKGNLNSQDIIFIEEKNDYNSFDRFKDVIELTSQVLTILAVINNLSQ